MSTRKAGKSRLPHLRVPASPPLDDEDYVCPQVVDLAQGPPGPPGPPGAQYAVTVAPAAPPDPRPGDIWIDTSA